ncbi:MLNS [Symbiodinium sp. CCMP2456]|nr:MLNS [Symbiodinium sp. CCMP2456]
MAEGLNSPVPGLRALGNVAGVENLAASGDDLSELYKAKEGAGAQLFIQAEELLASERYGEAEAEARRAAQSFRDAGSTEGAADAVRVVVKSLLGQGRRVEALAFAREEKEKAEDRTAVAKLSVSVAEASLGDAGSQAQAKAGLQEARRALSGAMEARALLALAALEMERGDGDLAGLEMGLRHAGEAKQKALELGNRRLEAMSLLLMVDGKGMMASPEDALEVADELLDLALELKDKRLEACTLRKLSVWNSKLGDRDRAISDAEEAWEIYCDLESPQEPQALRALVEGLLPVDPRRARRLCTESLSRLRQKGQKLAEVEVVRLLVEVLLRLGRLQEAASAAQDCIPICKEIGATEAQAALIVRLARARLQAGDFEKAKTMAENAWTMLDEAKATARAEKADAMEVLCDAQVQSTDLEDALARATDFREHFAVAGDARGQARALLRCAQLQLEMGDYETAFQSAQKACNLYHQERQKREEADAKLLCSKIFWRKADHKAAVTWAERARAAYRELEQTEDEVACLCVISENAARLAAREGASLDASEPAPRAARDALEKSLKSAEAGLKLLKVAAAAAAPELHGQLLCARAQALTFQGRFAEALGSLDEAVLRFRELDEYGLEANALLLACDNLFALNRAREAAEAATEALTLYQHCQDLEGEERARVLLKHPSLIATARPSEPRPGGPGPIPGADVMPVWLQQADAPLEEAAPVAARAVQRSTGPALDMASITPEAVMAKVRDIVSAVTGTELEEIDTETPLMEAGLTSSSAIVMQETLSKELGMKLPMTLVFDYPTIADMAEMVQEQTSQKIFRVLRRVEGKERLQCAAIKANLPGRRRRVPLLLGARAVLSLRFAAGLVGPARSVMGCCESLMAEGTAGPPFQQDECLSEPADKMLMPPQHKPWDSNPQEAPSATLTSKEDLQLKLKQWATFAPSVQLMLLGRLAWDLAEQLDDVRDQNTLLTRDLFTSESGNPLIARAGLVERFNRQDADHEKVATEGAPPIAHAGAARSSEAVSDMQSTGSGSGGGESPVSEAPVSTECVSPTPAALWFGLPSCQDRRADRCCDEPEPRPSPGSIRVPCGDAESPASEDAHDEGRQCGGDRQDRHDCMLDRRVACSLQVTETSVVAAANPVRTDRGRGCEIGADSEPLGWMQLMSQMKMEVLKFLPVSEIPKSFSVSPMFADPKGLFAHFKHIADFSRPDVFVAYAAALHQESHARGLDLWGPDDPLLAVRLDTTMLERSDSLRWLLGMKRLWFRRAPFCMLDLARSLLRYTEQMKSPDCMGIHYRRTSATAQACLADIVGSAEFGDWLEAQSLFYEA